MNNSNSNININININIEHLVLSGGGFLGISYIGLYKYFEEKKILNNLKSITGCSAGALFGTFFAIGYNSYEIENIMKAMIFKDYLKINVDSILNFINTKGFESGHNLNLFIKKCIKDKTGNENITFLEIQEKYKIKLQIGVTNLTKNKFELFNVDSTPDISVEKAISASIAIPFIFEPIIIGDDIYCDGGLLENLPIENLISLINIEPTIEKDIEKDIEKTSEMQLNDKSSNNTLSILGFYLISKSNLINKYNYKSVSLTQYINILTHTIGKNFISKKIEDENKYKYKIITIEIPCDIMTVVKLNTSHDDINNVIDIAYNITKNELKI